MNDLTLIIGLIFLAAAFGAYGAYRIAVSRRRERRIVNRRLELSQSLNNASAVLEILREERGFGNFGNPVLRRLGDLTSQTGLPLRRRSLGFAFLAVWFAVYFVVAVYSNWWLAAIVAPFVAIGSIVGVMAYLRGRRIANFAEQLPDAIDIITRGVRAGLPFNGAITLVAREMPDPVATEFGMLAEEITFGLDLRSALDNLYRRVGQEDLLFFTVAVSIQTQTGGNLAEILSRLSKLMRSRAKMRLKINALSAEGRLSAIALTLLPFALFAVVNFISPAYYSALRDSAILQPAIYFGLALLFIGNVIMYRMVHFRY